MYDKNIKFKIIRDSKERSNYWTFNKSTSCEGTEVSSLKTGDYTIKGLEHIFTIERKATTGEIAGNLYTKRFERELIRMEGFRHAYVICEFTMKDLCSFPYNSGIPRRIWPKLRVSAASLLRRLVELESLYRVKFIFAGEHAKDVAKVIFKRMMQLYYNEIKVNEVKIK